MPRKPVKRITRTVTVLCSVSLLGGALPAASLASVHHSAQAHRLHVAAGKGDPTPARSWRRCPASRCSS